MSKEINCEKVRENIDKLKNLKSEFLVELERIKKDGIAGNIYELKKEIEDVKGFLDMELKEYLLSKEFYSHEYISQSLKILKELIDEGVDKDYIAVGLAGVGTPEAMKMRQEFIDEGVYIAISFFGNGEYPEYVPAVIMKKSF